MSAWGDRTPEESDVGVRGKIEGRTAEETIVVDDLPVDDQHFFWRQVGTDIEVRVRPDLMAGGPAWQHQYAPTGLLTIHLAGDPEPEHRDPLLEPLETPGPTFVRQADWDEETQTWRASDG